MCALAHLHVTQLRQRLTINTSLTYMQCMQTHKQNKNLRKQLKTCNMPKKKKKFKRQSSKKLVYVTEQL